MPVVTISKYAVRQWAEGPGAARAARWVLGGCVVLIAYTAAGLTWQFLPTPPAAVAPPAPPKSVATTTTGGLAAKDYTALSNLHLFGEYKPPEVAPLQPVATNEPAVETQLRLNLLGILYDDKPEAARAMIANEQGEEDTYGIGAQVVPGAKIEEIHPDHVILSRNGKREMLKLPEDKFAEGEYDPNPVNSANYGGGAPQYDANYTPPPPPTDYNSGGQQYSPYGENPYNQNPTSGGSVASNNVSPQPSLADGKSMRQLREELSQHPERIGSLIRAAPVNKGGKFRGFRVSPGRDPKLFHQLGLKSGDVVTSVNGIVLDHASKGFQAMQQIATANSVAITVERKGQTKQFFVTMD
jgi:general secretion pathway protein C